MSKRLYEVDNMDTLFVFVCLCLAILSGAAIIIPMIFMIIVEYQRYKQLKEMLDKNE